MTAFELLRDLLALIGILCLLWRFVGRKRAKKLGGEDGPIRVKGGSVIIENDDFDWDEDSDDGPTEFFFLGRPRGWMVEVWVDETTYPNGKPDKVMEGRKAVVHVDGKDDFRLVFRANGSVRVIDKDGHMKRERKQLKYLETSRITKIEMKKKEVVIDFFDKFDPKKKSITRLTPNHK
jgi:hypothetical protein